MSYPGMTSQTAGTGHNQRRVEYPCGGAAGRATYAEDAWLDGQHALAGAAGGLGDDPVADEPASVPEFSI